MGVQIPLGVPEIEKVPLSAGLFFMRGTEIRLVESKIKKAKCIIIQAEPSYLIKNAKLIMVESNSMIFQRCEPDMLWYMKLLRVIPTHKPALVRGIGGTYLLEPSGRGSRNDMHQHTYLHVQHCILWLKELVLL